MAKKATSPPNAAAVNPKRATRLFRLLTLLGTGPQPRATILRRLRLDIRGFYRDLQSLRAVGVFVKLSKGKYFLTEEVELAINRLPFPAPSLTLGEARQLAHGSSTAHRKLRELVDQIEK